MKGSKIKKGNLVEQLQIVITSRIQTLEYKTKEKMSSFIPLDDLKLPPPDYGLGVIPTLSSVVNNNERIFELIEEYSKRTNLLMTMRYMLNDSNALTVLHLLEEDRFIELEKEKLERMLKHPLVFSKL